jgi:hypothetical protein
MKITTILFFLPFLMTAQQDETLKNGKYLAIDRHDDVYAIEISNNNTEIKFYIKENEEDKNYDYKIYGTGSIVKVNNKYFIENITSKNKPYDSDSKVEMKVKENILQFKTFKLMSRLYNTFVQYSDNLKFEFEQPK